MIWLNHRYLLSITKIRIDKKIQLQKEFPVYNLEYLDQIHLVELLIHRHHNTIGFIKNTQNETYYLKFLILNYFRNYFLTISTAGKNGMPSSFKYFVKNHSIVNLRKIGNFSMARKIISMVQQSTTYFLSLSTIFYIMRESTWTIKLLRKNKQKNIN